MHDKNIDRIEKNVCLLQMGFVNLVNIHTFTAGFKWRTLTAKYL